MDLNPVRLIAAAGKRARSVARAGVTTVLAQAAAAPGHNGTRVMAVKTTGAKRQQRIITPLAAIKYSWRGNGDPMTTAGRFKSALDRGKKYHEAWLKYDEELKKWQEEQAKKKANGEADKAAEEAKKAAAKAEEEEVSTTEKKADPLTGKWEIEISGGPLPSPNQGEMNLKLSGESVTGTYSGIFGDAVVITGTFDGTVLSGEIELEGAPFKPALTLTLDGEDQLSGSLQFGNQFSFDVSAKRTEKTFTEVTTITKRKKKSADGKPEPPKKDEALEPFRALFAGKTTVLLDIDSALALKYAVPLFAERKIPLVLMNAEGGMRQVDGFRESVRGVVVPRDLVSGSAYSPSLLGGEYAAKGLDVAFQNGGRGLGLAAAWAVRQGMSPDVALQALTGDAAKMFGIEDRVGRLAPGLDADVLVFSGDPFDLATRLTHVFTDGGELDLEDEE